MARGIDFAGLLLALTFLAGCETLAPEYRPDPRPEAAWEEQLRPLKCDYRRDSLSIRSHDPFIFAIMAVCYGGHLARAHPKLGYMSLLTVDVGRSELQAARITANSEGGLHYTATGDLIWFSSANAGTSHGDQQFIEVFSAPAGTVAERSLGRLELPFAANPPFVHAGDDCHVLVVSAFRETSKEPQRQLMWLFRDDDPVATAKPLEGVGRILYWNPVGKYFVTQKEPYFDPGPRHSPALQRSRLNCSGDLAALTGQEATRLANVTYLTARYLRLPNGDLVVASEVADQNQGGAGELLVFRDNSVERIGPFSVQSPCPDLGCVPLGRSVSLHGGSASGRHFLAEAGDVFAAYRVDDLATVRRWPTRHPSDRYVHFLVDDRTVLQLERGGRVAYYSLEAAR
jgi:hypothetical protein